ncbi:gag-pol [Trichonephila clavipes]|nr:gag-pol [Trichonephila clavipes]
MAAGVNIPVLAVVCIYIKFQNYSTCTKLRNCDGFSVIHCELIAIDTGLKETLKITGSNSIWILFDSRSAIQHLSYWHKILLQWVPSHGNIADNGIADSLEKDDAAQPTMNSAPLSYSVLHSTYINKKKSTVPPPHHWYEAKRPVVVLFPFNAAGKNKPFYFISKVATSEL